MVEHSQSPLLTTAELAQRLRYRSPAGVHMAVRRGRLPLPMRVGRRWLFRWSEVEAMLTHRTSVGVINGEHHDETTDAPPEESTGPPAVTTCRRRNFKT